MAEIRWNEEVEKRKEELIRDLQSLIQIKSVLDESHATSDAPLGKGVKEALEFMLKLGERFTFKTGGFFQPSLKYISDHILTNDTELIYQLWKGLQLNTRFMYNKISRTEKENLIFTYGLKYAIYF